LRRDVITTSGTDPGRVIQVRHAHHGDWTNIIVAGVVHGAAATEKWATVYKDIVNTFATKGDVAETQKSLEQAAADNGGK
jgi:hypothetical protein